MCRSHTSDYQAVGLLRDKNSAILAPRALHDKQRNCKLKIPVVFEQNLVNLSSERRAAVMHQTTKQQVVYEITTRQLGRHYSNSKVLRNMKLTVNKEKMHFLNVS